MRQINEVLRALGRSRFRGGFRLNSRDAAYLRKKGSDVIRRHAEQFVRQRLASAAPANDGRQTPVRGHPVFVAQHATGICCRKCLEKWHGISQDRALHEEEIDYIVSVMCTWLEKQMPSGGYGTPSLLFDGPAMRATSDRRF
jgi:hypothetical protein